MSDTVREVRFDDLDGLRALISEEFGPFGNSLDVTQSMIDQFAEITLDRQWIHVDVERAKRESPFGGTIAHGFLVLSLLPALRPQSAWKVVGYASAVNYGANSLRFAAPVPAGSKVHARGRLMAVDGKDKGTLLTTETAIHVVGNDRPAMVYQGLTLYRPGRA